MRPVTQSFLNTVRGPHKAIFRARVCEPGKTGVDPVGTEIPLMSGDATFDVNSDINGTCDFKTNLGWEYIAPYGQEVFLERGVQYGNGVKEYVGLGYFRVNSVEQDRVRKGAPKVQGGLLRITGEDRKANLRDGRLLTPVVFGSGASVGSVIDFLVTDVMPSAITLYDSTNWPGGTAYTTLLGADHVAETDRLKFIEELVAAYGKICYFDYAGRFVVKDAPTSTGASVFTVNAGLNGVLVSAVRAISRDSVYNAVVATGEPAGELPPVIGFAYDQTPGSPTYFGGGFGKVPRFYSSSFIVTSDQATRAATSILASSRGTPYTVSLGMVPNPALELWDVINVQYDEELDENHIIDTLHVALAVDGAMAIDTRKQYLV